MKITAETIARTVVLALALLNQVLAICGKGQIQIAENDIYQIVSLTFTAVAAVWSWWKNNKVAAGRCPVSGSGSGSGSRPSSPAPG